MYQFHSIQSWRSQLQGIQPGLNDLSPRTSWKSSCSKIVHWWSSMSPLKRPYILVETPSLMIAFAGRQEFPGYGTHLFWFQCAQVSQVLTINHPIFQFFCSQKIWYGCVWKWSNFQITILMGIVTKKIELGAAYFEAIPYSTFLPQGLNPQKTLRMAYHHRGSISGMAQLSDGGPWYLVLFFCRKWYLDFRCPDVWGRREFNHQK